MQIQTISISLEKCNWNIFCNLCIDTMNQETDTSPARQATIALKEEKVLEVVVSENKYRESLLSTASLSTVPGFIWFQIVLISTNFLV